MPKRPPQSTGAQVRLRFETVFLLLVWIAVILLVVFYPHLGRR
jgi:hypothetical protein